MSKIHSRSATHVFGDENQMLPAGGLHKLGGGGLGGQDAKRGKIGATLPQARAALGDISNANRSHTVHDGVKKSTSTTFPSLTTRLEHPPVAAPLSYPTQLAAQQPLSLQQPLQSIDPMDTTLEDNIADLSLTPTQQHAPHHSFAPTLDESDKYNAQMCTEYAQEILAYWRATEMKRAPSPTYMSRQNDINAKMREILVDWMVEVQLKFKLKQETLFQAIHILDRFLERRLVSRTKLQLVGCTALLLAAKYEEIWAPEVNDFVCISDKAYTREQILAMEGIMLNALTFNLTVPLSINFLQRFARIADVDCTSGDQRWFLAMYFMELTLQSYVFLNFPPSQIAASALYLAMSTAQAAMGHSGAQVWTPQQQALMEYTPAQLATCIHELYKLVEVHQNGQSKYRAVKKKYSLPKFMEVAKYTCKAPPASL